MGFSPRNGEIILKAFSGAAYYAVYRFSPRNGEIILKKVATSVTACQKFQSPQWGDNSKAALQS